MNFQICLFFGIVTSALSAAVDSDVVKAIDKTTLVPATPAVIGDDLKAIDKTTLVPSTPAVVNYDAVPATSDVIVKSVDSSSTASVKRETVGYLREVDAYPDNYYKTVVLVPSSQHLYNREANYYRTLPYQPATYRPQTTGIERDLDPIPYQVGVYDPQPQYTFGTPSIARRLAPFSANYYLRSAPVGEFSRKYLTVPPKYFVSAEGSVGDYDRYYNDYVQETPLFLNEDKFKYVAKPY